MDKKKKDLIPVAAIALFLMIIIILCAVRLTERKKEREEMHEPVKTETAAWMETEEETESLSVPDKITESEENKPVPAADKNAEKETGKESAPISKEDTGKQETKVPQNTPVPEGWVIPEGSVSSNNPYAGIEGVKKTNEEMLSEMAGYWAEGRTDAVEDLAGLPWFRKMSDSIKDENTFYYYGERNAAGQPEGTGIAVYADHEYYYGSWYGGKRQGQGEWFKRYVYYDNDAVSDRAYQVHMYMGEWANDLPNGYGQEHVDLNMSMASGQGYYIQNVIGTFQDGLYSGEMYLTTMDQEHRQEEWNGFAEGGIWSPYGSAGNNKQIPVCQNTKDDDNYLWLAVKENKDRGIAPLLK